jgi:hypothetical protein
MDGMGNWRPKTEFYASQTDGQWGSRNGDFFIINTIVSYLRCMFDDNYAVHVVAPMGMAAFNVMGEKLHRFVCLDWRNMKKGMTNRQY